MGIHVGRHGTGERILFVHGAGGSSQLWYFQEQYFSKSMEVILVDLPGHGKSSGEGCRSIEEYRDVIANALDAEGINKVLVAGQSMGGAVAMSFALAYPERLSGLILLGTGAKLKVFPEILEGLLQNKKAAVTKIMEYAFSKKTSASLVRSGFQTMMKTRKRVIYDDFCSCQDFDVMESLKTIEIPTLIVCGTDDVLTPPKFSEFMHREIKGSRLVLVQDAGHLLMLEKPKETNKAIEAFVAEIAGRR